MKGIAELEGKIGYEFSDKDLLHRALTRKAYAKEQQDKDYNCADQTVLSTLGDAVWKLAVSEYLLDKDCNTSGQLTIERSGFENEEKQVKIAQYLRIWDFIRTNLGEEKVNAKGNPRVLATTLEALIGAIFLDTKKYEDTKEVISKWFKI